MLFVINLFLLVSVVPAVIPRLSESWDFNLFVRLRETEKGYDFPGQLLLESRGNVMALPGRVFSNGKTMDIEDRTFITPCCRNWTKTGWMKVKRKDVAMTEPLLDYSFTWDNDSVPPAEIWALKGVKGSMHSPTISSTIFKYNRNNITVPLSVVIVARLSIESSISVNLVHTDESAEVLGEINGNAENAWVLQRLHHPNTEIQRNTDVRFEVIAKQPADWVTPLLIQWVSISSPSNQKTINLGEVSSPEDLRNTYFTPLTATVNVLERDPVCLHGGEIDVTGGRCKCRSGFAGTVCERGCGANKYGFNCEAYCSQSSDYRFCRGIFDCLQDGCKCMPGLEGDRCDQACRPGWYGNSCEQKCGHCVDNEPCDRFTGRCDAGCEDGFQPPFCQKDSCGLPATVRTEGANPRTIFFHSAIYEKKKGIYKAVCSGSLIAPRFLLSENGDNSTVKDFGDVGSGYMYYRNNGWYIYGVKSASAPDTKHKISAYTSVRNYADWILTKMNDLDVKYAVLRNT